MRLSIFLKHHVCVFNESNRRWLSVDIISLTILCILTILFLMTHYNLYSLSICLPEWNIYAYWNRHHVIQEPCFGFGIAYVRQMLWTNTAKQSIFLYSLVCQKLVCLQLSPFRGGSKLWNKYKRQKELLKQVNIDNASYAIHLYG